MTGLVVYYSKFGNTQKVAEAIAEALESEVAVRVVHAERLTASELKDAELVVMGSPTHRMNLPEAIRPVLEALPKRILRGASVAAFDTSYKMSGLLGRFTAAPKLARRLRKLGGRQVVRPETFYVVEREGPLHEGEIERAKRWGEAVLVAYSGRQEAA
jgi:flavodoxin